MLFSAIFIFQKITETKNEILKSWPDLKCNKKTSATTKNTWLSHELLEKALKVNKHN